MNLDARIAVKARTLVENQRQAGDAQHERESGYRSWCEGFPVFLRTCGLLNTLAFFDQKDDERRILSGHVREQLRDLGYGDRYDAVETSKYMLCSRMAMRVAVWHKRLAQALLRKVDER